MRRSQRIGLFVEEIWKWYRAQKRDLPWRRDLAIPDDNERAYRVLVSEVMLQQTQVERVRKTYRVFLRRFPTVQSLAGASNREVILAWRGMGYNNRALRLRDAVRRIVEDWSGVFPRDLKDLRALPGLGHYTAAAIRNFAFGIETPCLDTNIRRILHRTFVGLESADGTWEKDDRYLLRLAEEVLEVALQSSHYFLHANCPASAPSASNSPRCRALGVETGPRGKATAGKQLQIAHCAAAEWHAALMDFGALVQTKTNPKWEECPLTRLGICKAASAPSARRGRRSKVTSQKSEPGRFIAGRFVPNRIVRGRIVDELRDEPQGLSVEEIGERVCIDWSPRGHREWLQSILEKLRKDQLVSRWRQRFVLAE